MKALNPPIFFKQQSAFKTQINRWTINGISRVSQKLMDLEAQCKQTGAPVETLCSQAVLGISKSR
jgi:DNA polymerase III delta subunit